MRVDPLAPELWTERPVVHEARCAYCHGEFVSGDGPLGCPRCSTLLHDACWREARRCTSLGCAGPPCASA